MRKIQRLGAVVAMTALTVTVSACGSDGPKTGGSATGGSQFTAPSSSVERTDGVTTAADAFGPGCSQLPQGSSPGSAASMGSMPVAAAAATNPLLKTLSTAVKSANLVDVFNSQKEVTVLAPTDSAFDDLRQSMGETRYNALLANKDQLANVLKYHVVARRYDKSSLASERSVATLAGGTVEVKTDGDTLSVTDGAGRTAKVVCGNLPTSNATVFVIDKVLTGQPK